MRRLGLVVSGAMLATLVFSAVSFERADAIEIPECQGVTATIWGKSGKINGTSKRDVIVGSDEDDVIKGNGGDDLICGGWGNDKINGNTGNDWIFGEGGDDTVSGDAGNDEVWGDWGPHFNPASVSCLGDCYSNDDTVLGGTGNDLLVDFKGWNNLDGGAGNDDVNGRGVAKGGSGDDYLNGSKSDFWDWYNGTNINEADVEATGDHPAWTFDGGSGNDHIDGSYRDDILKGNSGNDVLHDNGGEDAFNGGSGKDECEDIDDATSVVSCEIVDEPV